MEKFWRGQENDFYQTRVRNQPSLANRLIQLANRAAYYESGSEEFGRWEPKACTFMSRSAELR